MKRTDSEKPKISQQRLEREADSSSDSADSNKRKSDRELFNEYCLEEERKSLKEELRKSRAARRRKEAEMTAYDLAIAICCGEDQEIELARPLIGGDDEFVDSEDDEELEEELKLQNQLFKEKAMKDFEQDNSDGYTTSDDDNLRPMYLTASNMDKVDIPEKYYNRRVYRKDNKYVIKKKDGTFLDVGKKRYGFSFQQSHKPRSINPNWIILDSQSTLDMFSNPRLLQNI